LLYLQWPFAMKNRYYIIKQLIEFLESFEEEDLPQKDLLGFAEWMITRIREEPSLNSTGMPRRSGLDYSEHFAYLKNFDEKARFLEYISRISRLDRKSTRLNSSHT